MKPSVLVSLVAVGLAALLIALSTTLGRDPQAAERSSTAPQPVTPTIDAPRVDAPLAGTPSTAPGPQDEGPTRSAEEAAGEQYDNMLVVLVVDAKREPVAGARLRLVGRPEPTGGGLATLLAATGQDMDPADARRGTTGPGGRHAFRSVEPGDAYVVMAEHADFAVGRATGIRVGRKGDQRVTIELDRGFLLRGVVRDDEGEPIRGARVQLLTQMQQATLGRAGSLRSITTDADGTYEIKAIPAGRLALSVSARGYATKSVPQIYFDPRAEQRALERDVVLPPARSLAGRVVDAEGNGIAGAIVSAFGPRGGLPTRSSTSTAADGGFRVADLQDGNYDVQVEAVGWRRGSATDIAADTADVRITLEPLASVRGRVLAARGESPTEFRVAVKRVQPNSDAFGTTGIAADVEHPEGRFELQGLVPGEYVVEGRAPGFAPTFSSPFSILEGGPTPEVEIQLTSGGTVRGRVVDKLTGLPVAGAKVASFENGHFETPLHALFVGADGGGKATRRSTKTDADGRFELRGLRPETYQIEISHPAHCKRVLTERMILEGAEDDLGTVLLSQGATVRGTVYGPDDKPLGGAKLRLMALANTALPGQPAQQYEGQAAADGTFVMRNLLPGRYRMTAARVSDNPFDALIDTATSEVEVVVTDGSELTRNLHVGDE